MAKQDTGTLKGYPLVKDGEGESIPSVEWSTYAKNHEANTKPVKVGLPRAASPVKGK